MILKLIIGAFLLILFTINLLTPPAGDRIEAYEEDYINAEIYARKNPEVMTLLKNSLKDGKMTRVEYRAIRKLNKNSNIKQLIKE